LTCYKSVVSLHFTHTDGSKTYRYQAIKQKEKSKLKIQKTQMKWQDNMNLYKNQGWNQVLRKGKYFLLRMWHPSWCPLCSRNETYSWQQYHCLQRYKNDRTEQCRYMIVSYTLNTTATSIHRSWWYV